MLQAFLLTLQLASPAQAVRADCTEEEIHALNVAAEALSRGDDGRLQAPAGKPELSGAADRCLLFKLHRSSLRGWAEARKLAPKGGPVGLQGPARQALEELEQLKGGALDIDLEYAQTAIRAAIAAAQDERAELELLLAHARDLAERLNTRGRRAVWPRPFNLLAGELWFEVDRFEEARVAFERAVRAELSPIALVGLARALSRLGRQDEACDMYRHVRDATNSLRELARQDLASCK